MLFPPPNSAPTPPAPTLKELAGDIPRPLLQIVVAAGLGAVAVGAGWGPGLVTQALLLWLPAMVGLIANRGWGRPAMALALVITAIGTAFGIITVLSAFLHFGFD